jgi:membrane-bound ClpP family serine protease
VSFVIILQMNVRLLVAIVSTIIWEALIAVIALWVLPFLGIEIPVPITILLALALGAWAVIIYRLGSRAMGRKTAAGQSSMVGTMGVALEKLNPEGMVRIRGELWQSYAAQGEIDAGVAVKVVSQEGLKLVVRRSD